MFCKREQTKQTDIRYLVSNNSTSYTAGFLKQGEVAVPLYCIGIDQMIMQILLGLRVAREYLEEEECFYQPAVLLEP
jgi:hypothetical protein